MRDGRFDMIFLSCTEPLFIEKISPQDALRTLPLAMSKALEEQGGLERVANFSGVYTTQELVIYFKSLRQSLEEKKPAFNEPISLTLQSINHIIGIDINTHIAYSYRK